MRRLLALIYVTVLAALAIHAQGPPRPVPADAPAGVFASGRALRYLQVIARAPHPTGSAAAAEVRRYVIAQLKGLGVSPTIQISTGIRQQAGPPYRAAAVENIIARLKGTGTPDDKAILLAAHTDSVPHSFGASDDGSGAAALLETLRALRAGPPLRRDVILLFTDGEELGLLGAQAFVARNPLARDVGLVLNFEARGRGGASYMFETSRGNSGLIRVLQRAAPHPIASSLMYSVYQAIPNDTDLSVFKAAGYAGLNFAFVDGLQYYHSPNDNLASLDERSLQQQGDYALSLARAFGDMSDLNARSADAVYFNIFGGRLAAYPAAWSVPLAAAAFALWAAVFGAALVRGCLTWRAAVHSAGRFALAAVAAAAAVQVIWMFVRYLRPGTTATTAAGVYFAGLICAAAAVVFLVCRPARTPRSADRAISSDDLNIGVSCWWLALAVITAAAAPGASYLFLWPLLFSVGGAAARLAVQQPVQSSRLESAALVAALVRDFFWYLLPWRLVSTIARAAARLAARRRLIQNSRLLAAALLVVDFLCVVPVILLAAPTIAALFSLIGLLLPALLMLPVVLVLGLILPAFTPPTRDGAGLLTGPVFRASERDSGEGGELRRNGLSAVMAVSAALLLGLAVRTPLHSDGNQRHNSILYACDTDRKDAFWVNGDGGLDSWTARFFQWSVHENVLDEYPAFRALVPRIVRSRFRTAPAPLIRLRPPGALFLGEATHSGDRALRVRLASRRGARVLIFFLEPRVQVISAAVNGVPLPLQRDSSSARAFTLVYTGASPQGAELDLTVRGTGPIHGMIADSSDGLPIIPGYPIHPRPPAYLPTVWSDVTVVTRRLCI